MANLNRVLLMGRLTRDPELRYTPQGVPVTEIGMAINREFLGSDNERRKETVFVDVTLWRRRAEVVCQWLKKGDPLFIEGRLSLDTWEQDGQRRSKLRVVADNFQFVSARGGAGRGPEDVTTSDSPPAEAEGAPTDYEYREAPAGTPTGKTSWSGNGDDKEAVEEKDIPF